MRPIRTFLHVLLLAASTHSTSLAESGPAHRVADVGPSVPLADQGGLDKPSFFQPIAGGDVFLAPAGTGPNSIWRTDGTSAGTQPTVSGSVLGDGRLIGGNGEITFFASGFLGNDWSVWATDGTPEGTVLLRSRLVPPDGLNVFDLKAVVVEGRLFFHDCEPWPATACDLWTSDGTELGTLKLVKLGRAAIGLSGSSGKFYFLAPDPADFEVSLWRTDGTASGTMALRRFAENGNIHDARSIGGEALVAAEGTLWITDGDSVERIGAMGDGQYVDFLYSTIEQGVIYFFALPAAGSTLLNVWRSDGTSDGTFQVLTTSVLNSHVVPTEWVKQLGSRVHYLVPGLLGGEPYEIWSSGLSAGDAQPVSCGGCSSIPWPGWIRIFDGRLYFSAESQGGHSLWSLSSTLSAVRMKTLCQGSCRTESPIVLEDRLLFSVSPASQSFQLWATDGSTSGTQEVASFSYPLSLYRSANLDAALFAAAPDPVQRKGLWMSRGTAESTLPLTSVGGQGSGIRELHRAGERITFLACREKAGIWGASDREAELIQSGGVACDLASMIDPLTGAGELTYFHNMGYSGLSELWTTGGTAASTRRVWDNELDEWTGLQSMLDWNGELAFWVTRLTDEYRVESLWRSDGSAAGTSRAIELSLGVSNPLHSTALGEALYFVAASPSYQVWRTLGTTENTQQLTDATPTEFSNDPEFTLVGSSVYFTGRNGIWKTDGSPAGTRIVVPDSPDPGPSGLDRLRFLQPLGTALIFQRTENGESTLWRTEGTPESTQLLAELTPSYGLRAAASFGGRLYFSAYDEAHGSELWVTDGTVAGTRLVRDIGPGPISSGPGELVVASGKLYFVASELAYGAELWESDGTSAGTRRVQDIAPLAASSAPAELTVAGDFLYFSADDVATGRELWALPLAAPTEPCETAGSRLCLNSGRFRIEVTWTDFVGNTGEGHAVSLSDDTGYFWYFDPSNVEMIVKVLDGRGTNGHYWVFYGSLSNVEFDVTILDTETGQVERYYNPSGTFASVGDITAFPGSSSIAATVSSSEPKPFDLQSSLTPVGACVPSDSRLCLEGGRFSIEAQWTDFAGASGTGIAVPLTADTGYFWFFSESVVEVVVKLVDGRPVNGNFWVYYGALSNVEYSLTVTDTVTGQQHTYRNAAGQFASVGDTTTF